MHEENPKIKKYLDHNGIYRLSLSEIVRQAYKDARVIKETPESKFINRIVDYAYKER